MTRARKIISRRAERYNCERLKAGLGYLPPGSGTPAVQELPLRSSARSWSIGGGAGNGQPKAISAGGMITWKGIAFSGEPCVHNDLKRNTPTGVLSTCVRRHNHRIVDRMTQLTVVATCFALFACGRPDAPVKRVAFVERDSAGVGVVENHADTADLPRLVIDSPALRLGLEQA